MPDQKVSTCLWFDREGEDAAKLYTSLIAGSRITHVSRYGEGTPMPAGTAMMVVFELAGTEYMALNGGPMFKHSEACLDRGQVRHAKPRSIICGRASLPMAGVKSQCFWLKDRYGVVMADRAVENRRVDVEPRQGGGGAGVWLS